MRFNDDHVKQWREEGFILIQDFFTGAEYLPVRHDFEALYGISGDGNGREINKKAPGAIGAGHALQFKNIDILPYQGSTQMNLISLHPQLIALAKALLGVDDVRLYQSHTWAKYTGEADYDQAFHCDFSNHTLTVPSDDAAMRTVDFVIYLTDVTEGCGPLHYITRPDADAIIGRQGAVIATGDELQWQLKARERSAVAPAGTLLAHSIDTFHRGSNMTTASAHRFTMTIGFKAAGNDQIGFHVWQSVADRPWNLVIDFASTEQLACLGIPRPGDPFWTSRTLTLTQARWPNWDMTKYFEACDQGINSDYQV